MCFSATGSFAISGVLTGIGAASMARNASKPHRMFAAVPLLFAGQQAAEGTVWLTIGDAAGAPLHRLAVIAFLGFAVVVWPSWLPLSLTLVERDPARRRVLTALSWSGIVVSICAAVLLALGRPVARVAGHSIAYGQQRGAGGRADLVYLAAYLLPTVVPFFVSTASLARIIGVMLMVSMVAAVVVQRDALTSVWCFFAAILSCLIAVAVIREQAAVGSRAAAPGAARPGA